MNRVHRFLRLLLPLTILPLLVVTVRPQGQPAAAAYPVINA